MRSACWQVRKFAKALVVASYLLRCARPASFAETPPFRTSAHELILHKVPRGEQSGRIAGRQCHDTFNSGRSVATLRWQSHARLEPAASSVCMGRHTALRIFGAAVGIGLSGAIALPAYGTMNDVNGQATSGSSSSGRVQLRLVHRSAALGLAMVQARTGRAQNGNEELGTVQLRGTPEGCVVDAARKDGLSTVETMVESTLQLPMDAFGDTRVAACNAILGGGALDSGTLYVLLKRKASVEARRVALVEGFDLDNFEAVGMARVAPAPLLQPSGGRDALLTYVVVRKDLRGQGLGGQMVNMVEAEIKPRFDRMYLWTGPLRRNFYSRQGYKEVNNWRDGLFDLKMLGAMHQLSIDTMVGTGQIVMLKDFQAAGA